MKDEARLDHIARIINPAAFRLGSSDYFGPDIDVAWHSAAQRVALKVAQQILDTMAVEPAPEPEPYRPVEERCEILAVEMADAGNQDAANILYEAEALIRGLQRSVVFWIGMYGEAMDALDECAGDDEEGWDRQQHAETMAEKLRVKHGEGVKKL